MLIQIKLKHIYNQTYINQNIQIKKEIKIHHSLNLVSIQNIHKNDPTHPNGEITIDSDPKTPKNGLDLFNFHYHLLSYYHLLYVNLIDQIRAMIDTIFINKLQYLRK